MFRLTSDRPALLGTNHAELDLTRPDNDPSFDDLLAIVPQNNSQLEGEVI